MTYSFGTGLLIACCCKSPVEEALLAVCRDMALCWAMKSSLLLFLLLLPLDTLATGSGSFLPCICTVLSAPSIEEWKDRCHIDRESGDGYKDIYRNLPDKASSWSWKISCFQTTAKLFEWLEFLTVSHSNWLAIISEHKEFKECFYGSYSQGNDKL